MTRVTVDAHWKGHRLRQDSAEPLPALRRQRRRRPGRPGPADQARAAVRALFDPDRVTPYQPDPYCWTEQHGLDAQISGELADRTVVLPWHDERGPAPARAVPAAPDRADLPARDVGAGR